LNSSISIRDKIITENNPSAKNFLFEMTTAIKEDSALQFTYKKYGEKDIEEETIYGLPICLKQYKQRWYMLLQKGTDTIRIYGLDRISNLEIVPNAENTPKVDIKPATYWDNYYGIYTHKDKNPEVVKLKVSPKYTKFLRSLPLHHSQKEVETNEDFSIFSYFLCIERDFISEILSNGTDIEVLEPQSLREEVSATIRKMLGKYEL
jgi:predicted DNA-binding transcriptional regulator YafY